MGYRWDAATTEIWQERNRQDPVGQMSHLTSGFDMNEINAIFMHPDTWAQYSAEVPELPPFFVKETLEERLSAGWVATTFTGMFTPVYFFAG